MAATSRHQYDILRSARGMAVAVNSSSKSRE